MIVSVKSRYFLLGLVVGLAAAMVAFVLHDQLFEGRGEFQVVNATWEDLEVRLLFPSGREEQFTLDRRMHRFRLTDTGEGSITAFVNGVEVGSGGYVTHSNPSYLLVIGLDHFSIVQSSDPYGT